MTQRLRDLEYVAFDTETTGLKPSAGDEIVSIAGIRICAGRIQENDVFDTLVNPGREIPKSSSLFHGIIDKDVASKPHFEEVLPEFKKFAADNVLLAYHAGFDFSFIRRKEAQAGVTINNTVLDPLVLSVYLLPRSPEHRLEDIAHRYSIDTINRHSALGDSLIAARIFIKQMDELEHQGIETLAQALDISRETINRHKIRTEF